MLKINIFVLLSSAVLVTGTDVSEEILDKLVNSLDRLTNSVSNCPSILADATQLLANSNLQSQVTNLAREVDLLKLANAAGRPGSSTPGFQPPDNDGVYFSVATAKRIHCYNCKVTYDQVHVNTGDAMNAATGTFKAPSSGHYLFQFHGLTEAGSHVKLQLVVNKRPVLYMYDRDIASNNNRFAMVGQSVIYSLRKGDVVYVLLHDGALKGGSNHAFTSLVGMKVGPLSPGEEEDENNDIMSLI